MTLALPAEPFLAQISSQDIERGVREDCSRCPAALGLARRLVELGCATVVHGDLYITIDVDHAGVDRLAYDGSCLERRDYRHDAGDFIRAYDDGETDEDVVGPRDVHFTPWELTV